MKAMTVLLGFAEGARQVIEFVVLLVLPVAGFAVLSIRNGRAHRRLAEREDDVDAAREPEPE